MAKYLKNTSLPRSEVYPVEFLSFNRACRGHSDPALKPAYLPTCLPDRQAGQAGRTGRLCVGRTNNNRLITIVILNEAQRSEEPPASKYKPVQVSTNPQGVLRASPPHLRLGVGASPSE